MHETMNYTPRHIAVEESDLASAQPGGRVFFLPGSAHRAERIAERFDACVRHPSPRGHTVFTGRLADSGAEVGVVSTGMGCPSLGIVVTELIELGVRRLLRVGSAGGIQPEVRVGHVVIGTGAVRDEHASDAFAPPEFPAVASLRLTDALVRAAADALPRDAVHAGLLHSKDSLHGREFSLGPRAPENDAYMALLTRLGCVGSEMEASHLFVLAHGLRDHARDVPAGEAPIEAGCVCAVLGAMEGASEAADRDLAEERAIAVALRAASQLVVAAR